MQIIFLFYKVMMNIDKFEYIKIHLLIIYDVYIKLFLMFFLRFFFDNIL